jgi:uncharacterized coiled-coil DUF342 family protein
MDELSGPEYWHVGPQEQEIESLREERDRVLRQRADLIADMKVLIAERDSLKARVAEAYG